MRRPRFEYQRQDARLTLRDALEEYYAGHPNVQRPETLAPESADLFRSHDICHVMFGLDTTLVDESLADIRTLLGTDVGARRYAVYLATNPDAKRLFREAGYAKATLSLVAAMPQVVHALWLHVRQRRRWPWHPPGSAFGRTLAELRAEYGIRVL